MDSVLQEWLLEKLMKEPPKSCLLYTSLQAQIDVIAQAFGCKTGEIHTSPCTGKWRGTSDMTIRFDNGASLFIGNHLTPKAKTVKVQTECVNRTLVQYNPEIVKATKEAALPVLLQREAKDNEIAAQKGLKPYTCLLYTSRCV